MAKSSPFSPLAWPHSIMSITTWRNCFFAATVSAGSTLAPKSAVVAASKAYLDGTHIPPKKWDLFSSRSLQSTVLFFRKKFGLSGICKHNHNWLPVRCIGKFQTLAEFPPIPPTHRLAAYGAERKHADVYGQVQRTVLPLTRRSGMGQVCVQSSPLGLSRAVRSPLDASSRFGLTLS
jgi:hypothetical protein